MLLRTSISNTKKFFKKTFCNFKSFFSGSYQRLPKTPPPFVAGLDMGIDSSFYSHFRKDQQGESQSSEMQSGGFTKNGNNAVHFSRKMHETQIERVEKSQRSMNIRATHPRNTQENYCCGSSSKSTLENDQRRMCLVVKKMKEMEKLDARNVDHALDIEEVLHYYSRLTCPAYLEIVDRFFMEIFAEFSASSSQTCSTIKPRQSRPQPAGLVKRRSRLEKSVSSSDFF